MIDLYLKKVFSTRACWWYPYSFFHWRCPNLHEQLALRWRSEGVSCQQAIGLTTTGPNFGGKHRWFICDHSGERVRKLYWCPVQAALEASGTGGKRSALPPTAGA